MDGPWTQFAAPPQTAPPLAASPDGATPDAPAAPWTLFAPGAAPVAGSNDTPAPPTPAPLWSVQGLRDAMAPTPGWVGSGILPIAAKAGPNGEGDFNLGVKPDWGPVRSFVNPMLDLLEGTGLATSAGGQNSPLAGKVSPQATGLLASMMVGNPNPLAPTADIMRAPFPGATDVGPLFGGAPRNTLLQDARPLISDPRLAASVTAKQAAAAGEQLRATATDLPAAFATLDKPPAPLIPGDNPTTAKVTGDPGIAAAEYTASRGAGPIPERVTRQQADFAAQISAQNDARVKAIQDIAPAADAGAVPTELQRQAAAQDAVSGAHVAGVRTGAAGDIEAVDAAGQSRVAGVQATTEAARARADTEGRARLAGLRGTADRARAALPGDLGPDAGGTIGSALRAPLDKANQAAWTNVAALRDKVDPDGTLGAVATPVRDAAAAIQAARGPYATPLLANETHVLDLAATMPDQLPFRDLKDYRSQLTNAITAARQSGEPTGVFSDMIKGVDDAMNNAVTHQAARDAAAVKAGTMRPEDAMSARFRKAVENADPSRVDPDSSGGIAGAGQAGEARPGGGGPAPGVGPGSGQRGPGDSPLANGPATQGRALETLHDWLISKGGVKDESGEFKAQDLDKIHHRGGGRLVNPNGLSHDYAREGAVEAGFLPPNADVNDFREAVQSHQPVYRINEAADAAMRDHLAHQGRLTDEARFASGANVDEAASNLGVRLSRGENDHAVLLHMLGAHPEEAIRQATRAGEETAFQANADHNAVGDLGVPLAARQAEMAVTDPGPPLVPMDADAAARYAAYRGAVRDRAATFDNAPGVGQALKQGRWSGEFRTPDSALPNIIVKVGSDGADVAKAYLKAGGNPAALTDAAGWSLRQAATRADGSLDPSKVEAWAGKRSAFLSAIPETAAKFKAVADAQRAVDVATKAEEDASKAGGKMDAATLKAASDEAAATLKQVTAIAQQTVDDAVAQRAAAIKDRQNSAVGKFLGDADPVPTIWSILNDKTMGAAKARQLKTAIAGNPSAEAGMRRMVGEAIEKNLVGVPKGVTSEEGGIAANAYQNFMKHAEPALAELLSPDDLAKLKATQEMMVRDYRSAQVGTGSSTTQTAAAGRFGVGGKLAGSIFRNVSAGSIGVAIGSWLGGYVGLPSAGAVVGGGVGLHVGTILQAAREAGIQNVADLKAAAYLNPSLFRVLAADVTPKNRTSLAGALLTTLRRASLVGAAQGNSDRRQMAEPPRNALLH